MRQGMNPVLVFGRKGEIIGFSTGSDACAEHECGSKEMQEVFCDYSHQVSHPLEKDKSLSFKEFETLIGNNQELFEKYFKAEVDIEFPSLLARKRLTKNLDKIEFGTFTDSSGDTVAFLCANSSSDYAKKSTRFYTPPFGRSVEKFKDDCLYGAWDCKSFYFAMKGEKLIKKFEVFAKKVKEGGALFAGTFYSGSHSGVLVVLEESLRIEHRVEIEKAQRDYELGCLLKMGSKVLKDLNDLKYSLRKESKSSSDPLGWSYLWTVWNPKTSKEMCNQDKKGHLVFREKRVIPDIAIAINPSSGMGIKYYGPYEPSDVSKFIRSEITSLTPIEFD